MAFGIPGSEPVSGDNMFLGRIQYDARVGFWKIVKRAQGPDGWFNEESEPFKNPTFLLDFGTIEIGYIKIASPPAFVLVPFGQAVPPQPQELADDAQGRKRKTFLPGCRVKVASPKLFGDADAYYFTVNSKTALTPMGELHDTFLAAPEAAKGLIPMVACTGTQIIEIPSSKGAPAKYYAPVFAITGWMERPVVFGERTVPAPVEGAAVAAAAAPAPKAAPAPRATPVAMPWDEAPPARVTEPTGMPEW